MENNKKLLIHGNREEYLESNKYINWRNYEIRHKANDLTNPEDSEVEVVRKIYEFVRDEIHHSWDAKDPKVTVSATDVLQYKTGLCWAKSNLLAALLRAKGIPCGICYQKFIMGDSLDKGYCIHALNVVYLKTLNRWIRLDARGNNDRINAQFSLDEEQIAFNSVRTEVGEKDERIVFSEPSKVLMNLLETGQDALALCIKMLPADELDF